jgi:uncharacterized membrane protein YbhN (UPF0104 family)
VKKRLIHALKYGLGLGLLVWILVANWSIRYPGGEEVGIAACLQKPIHLLPLVLAGLLYTMSCLLTFVRWYLLVRTQGLPFPLLSAVRLGLLGLYLNTFLPGNVGGDVIKAACIAREQKERVVAVATVAADRALGMFGLFWLVALLGCLFWNIESAQSLIPSHTARTIVETTAVAGVAVVIANIVCWMLLGIVSAQRASKLTPWLARFPLVGHSLADVWQAIWLYRSAGPSIALALAMSIVSHTGFLLSFYCAARTIFRAEEIPSLGAHFFLVPLGTTVRAFFPTPGGVGGAEYAYGKLYESLDYTFASGVLAALVSRVIGWLLSFAGYLISLQLPLGLPSVTSPDLADSSR